MGDIYYDKSGYGSKQRALQESREKDKSITKADIDDFFNKNIEIKTNQEGKIRIYRQMHFTNSNLICSLSMIFLIRK